MKNLIPFELLKKSENPPNFSPKQIKKMWELGFEEDDVGYLQILIDHQWLPQKPDLLLKIAILKESTHALNWLLQDPYFQKEAVNAKTLEGIKLKIEEIQGLDSLKEIYSKEKVLFKMLNILSPYLLKESEPYRSRSGDTLPTLLLNWNNYLIQEENWTEWLLQSNVYPMLELTNKKGESFFDKARLIPDVLYGSSWLIDNKNYMESIEKLESEVHKKRYQSIPKSSITKNTPRI